MRIAYGLFFILFATLTSFVFNRHTTIKGKVVSDDGKPVVNATVMLKGSKSATVTSGDGSFSIVVPAVPATLVCSAVGYGSSEYTVTEKNISDEIKIKLHVSKASLDEVVVVGYATAFKKNKTASVSRSEVPPAFKSMASTMPVERETDSKITTPGLS